jgi:trimeric autotransporter adhesin
MLHIRCASVCAVAALLFVSPLLRTQEPVAARIVAPIDESRLTVLSGGVSMRARAEFDIGRAPASTQMNSVRLVLSRSPQQEAALEKFMAEQLDPHSPNFRKWLTPDQFGKLYGPSDSDIQTLVTWLQSRGFTVQPVPAGRASVAFSGSVSQVEAAFRTEIHSFNAHGEEFLSNISNPNIPSALAPVVSGIAGLNTIKPRPYNIPAGSGTYDPAQKHFVPAGSQAPGPTPFLTTGGGTSSNPYNFYLVPADAATIYDTPNSFNASFAFATSAYTGAGVTIGIGGDAPVNLGTISSYQGMFLITPPLPTIINVGTPPTNTGDTDEAYIDTEISGGLAPNASIDFYTAVNLSDAINQAIEDNKVDIFSLSFGECEAGMTSSGNQLINQWWQQAAAQGIAVTVSTGDSGSAGCDNDNTEQIAQFGLQVSGFASTPYNIAVGGTDYPALSSNFTTYVSATNSSYYRSALGYIPESTWNGSTISNTTISSDKPYINASSGKGNIVAGSGGASSCSTNTNSATSSSISNCTGGYAKPTWQTGAGVPSDGVRDLPDISLFASNGVNGAAWLVCTDDQFTENGITYTTNCAEQNGGGFAFTAFGGTSTSAPAFAGILALVQESTGNRLGQAAKNLYGLYNGPNVSAIFHDTTTGNISVPCTSGTPNCSKDTAGSYFLTGYNTATGYDLATGLGSVNVTNLINYWSSASGGSTATVSATVAPSSATTDQTVTVTGSVTGSAGTPTGTVTLSAPAYSATYTSSPVYTSSPAPLDSSGKYSITIPVGTLQAGNDTLTLRYYGDSTYAVATGTATVTITGLASSLSITPASPTLISTQPLSVTVKVTGSGPTPTGVVNYEGGNYFGNGSLSAGTASFTIPGESFTADGPQPITVSYGGDVYYAGGSASSTVTVTVPPAPTVTVTPSSSSIEITQPLTLAIKVAGTGATPTGTITVTSGNYGSSAVSLSAGAATVTIPGESLYNFGTTSTQAIKVQYSGDINYSAATGTTSVVVSPTVPTVTVTPASASIYTGQPLTVTVQVAGPAGSVAPTGGVTLNAGGGSYSGALASGSATVILPANALPVGTDTLSVTYNGDNYDTTASGTASVTVTVSAFSLSSSTPTAVNPGSSATSTITISTSTSYSGSITLACSLTSSPAGAVDFPICSVPGSPITLNSPTTSTTASVSFSTTAASAVHGGSGVADLTKTGVATLVALLVFLGIPARRRAWRAIIGVFVLIAAFSALSACGSAGSSGGGGGGGGGNSIPGTTAGTYTFTVTATGTPAVSPAPTTTVTLTVN